MDEGEDEKEFEEVEDLQSSSESKEEGEAEGNGDVESPEIRPKAMKRSRMKMMEANDRTMSHLEMRRKTIKRIIRKGKM